MSERRHAGRRKSFLRGVVYFNNKNGGLNCIVRDLSGDGARIIFSENVTLPEAIDLHIVQKKQTRRARVTWRRGSEIGLGFGAAKVEPAAAEPLDAPALAKRVVELEAEIAALRKILKRMKREHDHPHDDEVAA
jgi:PilZ domain